MKVLEIGFVFLSFTVIKLLIIQSTGGTTIAFPEFSPPDFEFIDLSAGCAGFTDCIEYVGAVIYNLALGIIFIVLLLIELIRYIFEIILLLFEIQFTGVDGAPWWINSLMVFPFVFALGWIVYKAVRSGKSES